MFVKFFLFFCVLFELKVIKIEGRFEFTNIKCNPLDKDYLSVEYCFIKSINRTYKYISVKVIVFEKPVYDVATNFDLLKRNNGYHPFLYNITGPVCPFFENRKRYPVASFITGLFLEYSNFNHKCPYNHDFILEKLDIGFLNNKFTKYLPFPEGDYSINSNYIFKGINRLNIQTNFALLKRTNGYHPFLYNITGPVCPFLENRKRYPVASFITGLFLEHTNFNHKCPFNHDFILEKLDIEFLNNKFTKYLPFPEGDYSINSNFFYKGINRINIQVFFTIS